MKTTTVVASLMLVTTATVAPLHAQPANLTPPASKAPANPPRKPEPPPIVATPAEIQKITAKHDELAALVSSLKTLLTVREKPKGFEDLLADVEIYERAGAMALEFQDEFFTQDGIDHTLAVLDTGIDRARQLLNQKSPWLDGRRRVHGFNSALDGSVQPYGVSLPENYDAKKPARLYVWMRGRRSRMTESDFIFRYPVQPPDKPPVADQGQIQLDIYGRWNGAGWHWAAEADVWEAMAAVMKRYNVDQKRIILRGFSMGGEGAWHISLHNPDRFVAAEIGAGTWSRRPDLPGFTPYQYAALHIWENMDKWALNAFNLPIAGHDGENETGSGGYPQLPRGTQQPPGRGQLESSIRVREQLEREGFPSEGEPYFLRAKGTPSIFLISKNTGHDTSPEVRVQLDAFLKEHGDRGDVSPDHIRFITFTTRYNKNHWVTFDALDKHYERSEIDAERLDGGKRYRMTSKNVARLTLTETEHATEIQIDGTTLKVNPAKALTLEKTPAGWKVGRPGPIAGLHKVHALQGPIDDAFLDPFLLVRPTGKPWNEAVNQQALRTLARFDRLYARFLRAHPRVVDDKTVTAADFGKYNVVLFGDPGSNKWIAKVAGKLPFKWTKDTVSMAGQDLPASENFPVLAYPSPLDRKHYVVINTALTIEDREYRGDYGMPRLGDYALLKVKPDADVADVVTAGLFDETWQMPKDAK